MDQPVISSCSIVLLGQFNPAIFHPAWLEARGIEESATTSPDGDLLTHPSIANFSIDTRSYRVRTDLFQIETLVAPWVMVLDITTKIFAENLVHTPITGFGINRSVHFSLPSKSSRIRLGRILAPIEPWGEYGQGMDADDASLTGGLQTLMMRRSSLLDGHVLETNVTIEPSIKIPGNTGVYMHVNCHHSLADLPHGHGSEQAMNLLSKRFDTATKEAETIIEAMMKKGKEQ